tara:strand:+ start:2783 stop:3415 length:633 start_codon:yes stop_codon:yes gene_type:complete
MQDLKDIAAQKAREKMGVDTPAGVGYTSYQELMKDYDFTKVTTSRGTVLLIEPVRSGLFFLATGSPLLPILEEADVSTKEELQQTLGELGQTWVDEGRRKELLDFGRCLVCAGVTSHNIVMKRMHECDEKKEEVPVYVFTDAEIDELVTEIMRISEFEEATEKVNLFREEGEGEAGEGEPAEDLSDSETVQPETERPIVSEGEQPSENYG